MLDRIADDLKAAGPAPEKPSYGELLKAQSAIATRYLKGLRYNDGSTGFERFEKWLKTKYHGLTLHHERDPIGYPLPKFEEWRDRTVAAQIELSREDAQRRLKRMPSLEPSEPTTDPTYE